MPLGALFLCFNLKYIFVWAPRAVDGGLILHSITPFLPKCNSIVFNGVKLEKNCCNRMGNQAQSLFCI